MKTLSRALVAAMASLILVPAYAQFGGGGMGGPPSPQFGGRMAKLFGKNSAFTALLEMQAKDTAKNQTMTMPGRFSFDEGKSRFEMDMSQAKGNAIPRDAAAQMKAMGMDTMVMIARPDKKANYLIYPGLKAYAEMPNQDPDTAKLESDFKVETTELGKETVEGHPCVKNKAVVTDDKGKKSAFTVWNATDLKDFPIKLETTEQANKITLLFKEVKLSKPAAGLFDPPSDMKRYENVMALMQEEMMKRMGGGMGAPPKTR